MGKDSNREGRWGVLLLAHGAPGKLEDVDEFLLNIRGGRPLPAQVVEEIRNRYALIGGGSPLLGWTEKQAKALAKQTKLPVYFAMRNWKPFIADVVPKIVAEGIGRLVVICLAPQNSQTSVGLYRKGLEEALEASGAQIKFEFVENWHDQPKLIEAFAEKVRDGLAREEEKAGAGIPVILTAHSVPEQTIEAGDPYDAEVKETAKLVAEAAGLKDWRQAYQSQGMTKDIWIGPKVESVIDALAESDHRHVFIAPIGFVCDHVEILFDIDILFKGHAQEKGIALSRSNSLNDSPLLIDALQALVEERMTSATASG